MKKRSRKTPLGKKSWDVIVESLQISSEKCGLPAAGDVVSSDTCPGSGEAQTTPRALGCEGQE